MNIKPFFILLILCVFNFSNAQEMKFKPPDYDLIKKNTEDKNSEFYYPNLLKKLKENDTLITEEQYRNLYFGQIFQKNYNPYKRGKNDDELRKYYASDDSEKDYPKIIKAFREALDEDPLNIRAMNFLAYMYHLNGEEIMAEKISKNFHGLLSAIISSGNGLKCGTAFHIISVPHEYVLLNMFGLENKSQSFDGTCDYLEFEKDKYKVPGIYFNVSKMQEKNLQLLKSGTR